MRRTREQQERGWAWLQDGKHTGLLGGQGALPKTPPSRARGAGETGTALPHLPTGSSCPRALSLKGLAPHPTRPWTPPGWGSPSQGRAPLLLHRPSRRLFFFFFLSTKSPGSEINQAGPPQPVLSPPPEHCKGRKALINICYV